MDTRPEPAKRLEIARRHAGFDSQAAAVERFGWSPDTYAQHENGTRGLVRAAKKYAAAYKVSAGWLLSGDGPGPGEDAQAIAYLSETYRLLDSFDDLRDGLLQAAKTARLAAEALSQHQAKQSDPEPEADG